MRSILFFAIALLIICSTIQGQRGRKVKTCTLKYRGRLTKIPKIPRNCCSAKKSKTIRGKRQSSASKCAAYCPILHKLKGCDFMCHFDHCKDRCQTECPGTVTGTGTGGGKGTGESTTEESGSGDYF